MGKMRIDMDRSCDLRRSKILGIVDYNGLLYSKHDQHGPILDDSLRILIVASDDFFGNMSKDQPNRCEAVQEAGSEMLIHQIDVYQHSKGWIQN